MDTGDLRARITELEAELARRREALGTRPKPLPRAVLAPLVGALVVGFAMSSHWRTAERPAPPPTITARAEAEGAAAACEERRPTLERRAQQCDEMVAPFRGARE